jgi:hypothetical protein
MRFAAAQMFHAVTVFYLLTMDLLYALKVVEVLTVRTDLLWAHYRGLGLQFFTVWSQVSFIHTNGSKSVLLNKPHSRTELMFIYCR